MDTRKAMHITTIKPLTCHLCVDFLQSLLSKCCPPRYPGFILATDSLGLSNQTIKVHLNHTTHRAGLNTQILKLLII